MARARVGEVVEAEADDDEVEGVVLGAREECGGLGSGGGGEEVADDGVCVEGLGLGPRRRWW